VRSVKQRNAIVSLQISNRQSADVIILDLHGRATIGPDSDLLNNYLRKLIEDGTRNVLLNMTGLTQVDSSSLATIVRALVSLRRQGGSLKLLKPCGSVKVVFEIFHLLDSIPHYEDEAQAVASFRQIGC
jgi:anti-sigma B factor antagonist